MAKFNKKLLYKKDSRVLIEAYQAKIPFLQTLRNEAELIIKKPLEDKELEALANSPEIFVTDLKESIKSNFQFKDATDEWNLQSKGIYYKDLDSALNSLPVNDFKYKVVDNRIQPLDSEIKRLQDSMIVWTKSQKQNEILKVCQDLCKNFETLDSLYPIGAVFQIQRVTNNLLSVGYDEKGKIIPVVNNEMIEYLD